MAAKEMYDYFVGTLTADYVAATLTTYAHGEATEEAVVNGEVVEGDDGSEEYLVFDEDPVFFYTYKLDALSASDAGTIFDFYCDKAKANGSFRTFLWAHPSDGHTYVVRFVDRLRRGIRPPEIHSYGTLTLKVLGNPTP